jgi:hypothetical protein
MVLDFFLQGGHPPNTGGPNDTDALFVDGIQVEPGGLERFGRGDHSKLGKAVEPARFPPVKMLLWIKPFDLAGKTGFKQSSIEEGNGVCSTDTLLHSFEECRECIANGSDGAKAGNNDSFHAANSVGFGLFRP